MPPKKRDRKKNKKRRPTYQTETIGRTRFPREGEVLGYVVSSLGDRRMEVFCSDREMRIARIPGRFKRGYRIKPGDVVVIEPWYGLKGNRADISHRYRQNELRGLARNKKWREFMEEMQVRIPTADSTSYHSR
ncbi:MAG: hypothetical protein ACXAEU_06035 [Candidatus Hodarchaeales archaeon]|jgi:translation initiation factor 1A